MSLRGTRSFSAGRPRVSQIFKKRNVLINADVTINADAVLLGTIAIRETGTIYAVKLSLHAFAEGGATVDGQRVIIWLRCVPNNTTLPDLTAGDDMDTINGFPAALLYCGGANQDNPSSYLNEKFRFRRKADDNFDVELLGQHTNVQGAGRVVNVVGIMSVIVRVR